MTDIVVTGVRLERGTANEFLYPGSHDTCVHRYIIVDTESLSKWCDYFSGGQPAPSTYLLFYEIGYDRTAAQDVHQVCGPLKQSVED